MSFWEEPIRAYSTYSVMIVTTKPALVTQLETIGLVSQLMISMITVLDQIMQPLDAQDLPSQLLLGILPLNQLGPHPLQWRISSVG